MAEHTVTLTISENAYLRASQIAQNTARPIEHILSSHIEEVFDDLTSLPADEQAELAALNNLSDDTLWTIAAERMPPPQQERLSLLLAFHKRSVLSEAEQAELDDLLVRGDKLTLRKAEAAAILTRRGHQASPKNLGTFRE